jgi:hypothetical protein
MKRPFVLAALIGSLVTLSGCVATDPLRDGPPAKTDQVRVVYVAPKDEKHQAILAMLRERSVDERLRELLSPIRLPRRLTVKFEGCDGVANAYYEDDAVTICYEYLEFVLHSAPEQTTPGGLTPANALIGPTVDVILHEVGHAVFDMLEIPVLGREEDAADLFSAYILLQFDPADAQHLIRGTAFLGAKEAAEAQKKQIAIKDFADEHGLPAQRYFTLLCVAYGSDPKAYADAVSRGGLTKERAEESCPGEYAALERAFRTLILPHVDQALLKEVRAKVRFQFDAPK